MANKIQTPVCAEVAERIKASDYFRIVVFGASNTDRYMPGIHWSDVLETGIRSVYGRKFHLINAGVSGGNTREALERFDRDVASFSPDIVIITFAGNDCNPHPPKYVSEEEFAGNLDKIVARIRALGAIPVLQTYYRMYLPGMEPERAELFVRYMDVIREAAARNNVFLVDQYKYFDALPREVHLYKLMLNAMHVNEYGNTFIGTVLLKHFGLDTRTIPHSEALLPAAALYDSIAE